jgi:tetratricopeptide (TPR) repeat protein
MTTTQSTSNRSVAKEFDANRVVNCVLAFEGDVSFILMSELQELNRAICSLQPFAVQRAAAKLITASKHVDVALHASVVALLNDDKWDEVIVAANVRPALQFHKAYALYKKERFTEALAVIAAADDSNEWRHLNGQILFRLGRHADAAAVYEKILTSLEAAGESADPLDLADARANLAATLVASDQAGTVVRHASFAPVLAAIRRGEVRAVLTCCFESARVSSGYPTNACVTFAA